MGNSLRLAVQKISKLPTLPHIAQEILAIIDNENASTGDVERIINRDPSIAAKILSFSSSIFFGGLSSPKNIQEAVVRIGFSNVKNIAVGISLMSVLDSEEKGPINYERVYSHSLSVAGVAEVLEKKLKLPKDKNLSLYGLLHDIGYLVLNRYFADIYKEVLEVHSQGTTLVDAERVVLGFTHSDVGEWLADKWKLPTTVKNTIRFHHAPTETVEDSEEVALIHMADYIVSKHITSIADEESIFFIDVDVLPYFGITNREFKQITSQIHEQFSS